MLQSEFKLNKPEFDKKIEDIMTGKKHLSYSSFKNFMNGSPRQFFAYKMQEKTQTQAMLDGIAFHMSILEPEKYKETYVVFDDSEKCNEIGGAKPRATAKYKQWKVEKLFEIESKGKIIIEQEKDSLFKSFEQYLKINSLTKKYFKGIVEVEKNYNFEYNGLKFMSKVDMLLNNGVTVDLKKCADASTKRNIWTIRDIGYDLQGLIYCLATESTKHVIINIDSFHNVSAFEIKLESLQKLEEKLNFYTNKFIECAETDSWHEGANFFLGNNAYDYTIKE